MTQRQFYKSMAWRRARDAFIQYRRALDGGICQVCHQEPGKIVHHIIWLNDDNCNDPDIALNPANFRYECQTCHNKERNPEDHPTFSRYRVSPDGSILPPIGKETEK